MKDQIIDLGVISANPDFFMQSKELLYRMHKSTYELMEDAHSAYQLFEENSPLLGKTRPSIEKSIYEVMSHCNEIYRVIEQVICDVDKIEFVLTPPSMD